ncbi:hypothetical protein NH340_JMT04282 [Sarcoptes scabiei]|nr:hypothetical protein NH340_JMT04282 [Sarcoptes scabiei]
MNFVIDNQINAMAVSRDGLLAVAGRSLLKVYGLSEETGSFGSELYNLRSSNIKNLNFSNIDVAWGRFENETLATAATNGAVVIWNLQHSNKSKIAVVFNDHKRTVNKVCFHNTDPNLLLSGSQDGCMKLFDLRKKEAASTFVSNSESVRDVQFSPLWTYNFASVQETGNVEIWDIRRPERPENNFIAHDGPVFACEWHPNQDNFKWLATGGRDKTIKIWDLSNRNKVIQIHNVHTITPVSKLKWRPEKNYHIGSCSLVVDFSVYVWDIKRPYVPFAIFGTRKDVTTGFSWKNNPFTFISSCKDGTIYQHRFENDAYYPAEHYPPNGIDINPFGDIAFSTTDFIYRHSQAIHSKVRSTLNSSSLSSNKTKMKLSLFGSNLTNSNNNITIPNNQIPNASQTQSNIGLQSDSLSSSLNKNSELNGFLSSERESKITRHFSIGSPSNQFLSNNFNQKQHFSIPTTLNNQLQTSSNPSTAYNISVPISYRKTNENILTEHFRCMISYMMLFSSKQFINLSDNLGNEISMNHFIYSARNYLLFDRAFEELCEHNAQVADRLGRHQIAQSWRIIRHMFSIGGRHPTSSGGGPGGNNPSGGSLQNMLPMSDAHILSQQSKTDNPSRHTSGGGGGNTTVVSRNYSGNNSSNIVSNANHSLFLAIDSKDLDKEESMENASDGIFTVQPYHHNHFPTMDPDTMPSNKFVIDFFDFPAENQNSGLDLEQRNHQHHFHHRSCNITNEDNLYDFELNCHDWALQRESIFHRHNIAEYSIQMNELNANSNPGENSLISSYEANSSISYNEDDEIDFDCAPGLFDVNVQALLSSKNPAPPIWPFIKTVDEMLRFYVDSGDVQTAVSIILVLGDRMKQITSIDDKTINVWLRSYIDLLHRFRLWNISTRLIQLSSDQDIQSINQSLTSVLVHCALCFKPVRQGSVQCEKCHIQLSNCAICHVTVRGLYIWCQGCAHGGHLKHMLEWFKTSLFCPTGCGHQCEIY